MHEQALVQTGTTGTQESGGLDPVSFKDIIVLSERMCQLAGDDHWEDVARLETRRQALMHSYFETLPYADPIEEVARGIERIMRLDRDLMELGSAYRGRLAADIKGLDRGRRATAAYQSAAS